MNQFKIREVGSADVREIAGEIPWKSKVGDRVNFYDGRSGKTRYSVEWTAEEVELYRGQRMDIVDVLDGLGEKKSAAQIRAQRKAAMKWWMVAWVVWPVMLFSCVAAGLGFGLGDEAVYSKTVDLCSAEIGCTHRSEQPLGPIELNDQGRVYKIKVSISDLPTPAKGTENWKAVFTELLDSDKQIKSGFTADLWKAYWVEGGESGVEANYSEEKAFRLDHPGTYYLAAGIETSTNLSGVYTSCQYRSS